MVVFGIVVGVEGISGYVREVVWICEVGIIGNVNF